jgi:hypothetical protein
MIQSITAINYLGEALELDLMNPEKSGFVVKSIKGLGPSKGIINTTEVSTNDGSIYNSARKSQRNIVMQLGFLWRDTIEDTRHLTYKYFPVKKMVTLVFKTDRRQCMTTGYVESNEPDIFSRDSGCQISIICPDPSFYSLDGDSTNKTVFNGIEPLFEFEFENEGMADAIEFGEIQNKTENVVVYDGDDEVGVRITIYALGPATNITIYNSITREMMKIDTSKIEALTGQGIIARDEITICTVKGNKGITLLRDGKTTNILNCLGKNVDWFQLAKGDNVFAYSAEDGAPNLQFRVENDVIYEGV